MEESFVNFLRRPDVVVFLSFIVFAQIAKLIFKEDNEEATKESVYRQGEDV